MRFENSVPEDLIVDIFAKLPVKSLIRFMCLSKSCYQTISDPQFFRLHLRHSNQSNKQFVVQNSWAPLARPLTLQSLSFCHHQLRREPVTLDSPFLLLSDWQWKMVGSCNGVLCLTTSAQSIHYLGILNPSIKKLKLVLCPNLGDSLYPSNGRYRSVDGTRFTTGFGFDSLYPSNGRYGSVDGTRFSTGFGFDSLYPSNGRYGSVDGTRFSTEIGFGFDSLYPSNGRYRSVVGTRFSTKIGFGFDSCTNDFKIVIIVWQIYPQRWSQVQVYSLRKNSWKVLSNVPNSLCDTYEPQVVVNGACYWFVRSVISGCSSILMFDFTDETFKEIRMPDCFYEDLAYSYEVAGLGEVKGKLSLLLYVDEDEDEDSSADVSLEMWMMEDSGWVRRFVVNVRQLDACLAINDEVMLLSTLSNDGYILSCDLKTLELTHHEVEEQGFRAFTYTPSLALLGEENEWFEDL